MKNNVCKQIVEQMCFFNEELFFGVFFSQKIAFIGINDKTLSVINKMENHPYGKRIVGYFDFKNHDIRFPYLGNLEKISNIVLKRGLMKL